LPGSQLVAEGQILKDHVVMATAGQGDRPEQQQGQFNHVLILPGVAAERNTGSVDHDILANEHRRNLPGGAHSVSPDARRSKPARPCRCS
jgi:hypothetical protein